MSRIRNLITILALALGLALPFQSEARGPASTGGPFGLGIVLGDPTGLSVKYGLDRQNAIDGGLSFSFDRWFLVWGDWLHHFPGAFGGKEAFLTQLTPYIGVGGVLVLSNKNEFDVRKERYFTDSSSSRTALGLRIPIGIEWRAPTIPLGVFLEIVPGLIIIPGTYSFVQGGIGVRYYF